MVHLLSHLLQHIFKLLAWADENLPDSNPLGWKLMFIGLAVAPSYFALRYFPNPSDDAIVLVTLLAFSGCLCAVAGAYVLFRRLVYRWQDRRPERIISMKWK
jgi:hypothetical protein